MNTDKNPIEPEIVNPGGKDSTPHTYRRRYTEYSTEAKKSSPFVFLISLAAFFLSLIPILGVSLALVAMIAAKIKKSSMILAIIAFVIGCISTTLFLLLALVLRWIF